MTADGDDLPNPSRVVRDVPYSRMERDSETDEYLRPYPSAFQLKEGERDLSVTWCEYFSGSPDEQLRCAIEALRKSRVIKSSACFCAASTPNILGAIADAGGKGRAVFLPVESNQAHAGILGIDRENTLLLQLLSEDVWCEFLTADQANALPISDCAKGPNVK